MTAASGIVHEEMHGRAFTEKGGTLEMVQLWVNLPANFKRSPPGYQDILDSRTPVVSLAGGAGTVRVIAGEFEKAKGPARTFTPIDEPVVGYGPFVMNTEREIRQAIEDYRHGRMGHLD
jgi:redox-sensitive bicupin YhaK (pirin superfamily)